MPAGVDTFVVARRADDEHDGVPAEALFVFHDSRLVLEACLPCAEAEVRSRRVRSTTQVCS